MFLDLAWYWWLLIIALVALSIPFKIRFMKWWSKRSEEQKKNQRDKWGDEK